MATGNGNGLPMVNVKVRLNKTFRFVLKIFRTILHANPSEEQNLNQYCAMLLLRYQIKLVDEYKVFIIYLSPSEDFSSKNISSSRSTLHTVAAEYHTYIL